MQRRRRRRSRGRRRRRQPAATAETTAPPDTGRTTPDLRTILGRQQDAVIKVDRTSAATTRSRSRRTTSKRSITDGTSMSIVTPTRLGRLHATSTPSRSCLEVPEGVEQPRATSGLLVYDDVAQGLAVGGRRRCRPIADDDARRVAGRARALVRRGRRRRRSSRRRRRARSARGSRTRQVRASCVDVATRLPARVLDAATTRPTTLDRDRRSEKPTAADCQSRRRRDRAQRRRLLSKPTSQRHSPRGGASWPAAPRSRAAMIASISPGRRLPTPTSTSVPTIDAHHLPAERVGADLVAQHAVALVDPRRLEHACASSSSPPDPCGRTTRSRGRRRTDRRRAAARAGRAARGPTT